MPRFVKKPITIEAVQWWKHGDHPNVVAIPDNITCPEHVIASHDSYGWCETLEGGHIVSPGDYIITGIKGEHYPCKPDIFLASYDLVGERTQPLQP